MSKTQEEGTREFARNGTLTVVLFVASVLAGVVAVMNFILHKPVIAWIWLGAAVINTLNSFFNLGSPFVRIVSGRILFRPALLRSEQVGELSEIDHLDVQKKKVIVSFASGTQMKIHLSGMNKADRPELVRILRQAAGDADSSTEGA